MEFALQDAKVRLMHKNDRLEKHGEDEVLACDLDFEYDASNEVLELFHVELRGMLYRRPTSPQGELTEDPAHLTELRCAQLDGGDHKFSGSLAKAELVISKTPGKKPLVFPDVKITKFRFQCKDGGTVTVRFQAQVNPDEAQCGKLSGLLQDKHCLITIRPDQEAAGAAPK